MTKQIEIACEGAQTVPFEKLEPFQGDLKDLSEENYQKLRGEILERGFSEPVSVWKNKSKLLILNGHQRVRALSVMKGEGFNIPPIPVSFVHAKDEREARMKVLSLTSQYGNMTGEGLYEYLTKGGIAPSELEHFNFPEVDFKKFVDEFYDNSLDSQGKTEDDAVPKDVPARTKIGQIWKCGSHRVMCGDATSKSSVIALLAGAMVDLVFTDPPYGVNFQSGMSKGGTATRFDKLKNDDKILEIAPVIESVMKADTAAFIWTSHQVYPQWRTQFSRSYRHTIIWYKAGGGIGDLKGNYASDYEMCLFCVKGRPLFRGKRGLAVWPIAKDNVSDYLHPTQKPVALADHAINDFSDPDSIVLDLFGGSGSTLIACEKNRRRGYVMELDPGFCDVILKRWEDYTGQRAELVTVSDEAREKKPKKKKPSR
jgi:DNA modification methylase